MDFICPHRSWNGRINEPLVSFETIRFLIIFRHNIRGVWWFGVKLSGPARVFCDNEAVVKSSTIPESRLKKKHCSIAYHRCREAVAAGKSLIYYEKSETNLADILTKSLSGSKRDPLAESLLSG